MYRPLLRRICFVLVSALLCSSALAADPLRVLPEGKVPNDKRLAPPKDLDGYFPLAVPKSVDAWKERAERVRRQLLVATGLWPKPTAAPFNAVVHGLVDRDNYTVERVYLESYPGHFVTGSLYKPKGKTGKLPAVLCPHGHWAQGRFHEHSPQAVKNEIATGAERFLPSGRYPLQARCVQLARMGCIVFHYDMIGYADSTQLSFDLVHRFGKQRPEMDGTDHWGFYSAQAESRVQSVMGVQTYNNVRALDWICSLPDVDATRIGVTGASGGGTQTFILSAIDPRPLVAFPAVMVSTGMQGGCTCENCSLLRVETGNIEISGLIAPRPLGMTAADDWTKEIATKGLPELQQLYTLLGAKDNVMAKPLLHFPHNYNGVSRMVMYNWMNKHFKLGFEEPVIETEFQPLTIAEMTVWDDKHPKPQGGPEYERSLTKAIAADSDQQIAALTPKDGASLAKYREIVGGAIDVVVGRPLPPAGAIAREKIDKQDRGAYFASKDILRNTNYGEELPAVFLTPKQWNGQVVIWIDGRGKAALVDSAGEPQPEIAALLASGVEVASADLLFQGEFLPDGKPLTETPVVKNPREFAGYTFGYNHALAAQRAHDVLTLVSFVANDDRKPKAIHLVGVNGAGPAVAAASAQCGAAVQKVAVDTGKFRFRDVKSYRDENFLPGVVKYGDLPALLALAAPGELWLAGEGDQVPEIIAASYKAAGEGSRVVTYTGNADGLARAAAAWIVGR